MRLARHALLREGLPWAFLAVALVLATAPVWRHALGTEPSIDDLLSIRCFSER